MHPNPLFHDRDRAANLAFVRRRGFGVITVNGPTVPLVTHVPFVLDAEGTSLAAHLSRANPLLAELAQPRQALVVVSGPDAYVSPDWYDLEQQVPTWNYVAVHLRGRLAVAPEEGLEAHLEALAAAHEAVLTDKVPWSLSRVGEPRRAALMRAIVPVHFVIEEIDGTWKLGQNKPAEALRRAASRLREAGYGLEAGQVADWMQSGSDS